MAIISPMAEMTSSIYKAPYPLTPGLTPRAFHVVPALIGNYETSIFISVVRG